MVVVVCRQYGEIVRNSWDAGAVVVIPACCLRRMRQWTRYPSRLAFRRDWKMVTGWWWYNRVLEANGLSTLLVLGRVPVYGF